MVDINAPLLNRLMKEKKGDVIHSSAYAKAQNQGGIGSSSMQSFEQRKVIDQNRSIVRKYGDSKIAMEAGKTSWQARRDAAQFGESDDSGKTPSVNGLRGKLNSKDADVGTKGGDTTVKNGPSQMPTRRNPGISR